MRFAALIPTVALAFAGAALLFVFGLVVYVPFDMAVETKRVTSADTLPVRLAAGGGQAIHFVSLDR